MSVELFSGKKLFELRATHGLPLDFALDSILPQMMVDWPGYIEAARENGRWDFQTLGEITHALIDQPAGYRAAVIAGFKNYVMANPLERTC